MNKTAVMVTIRTRTGKREKLRSLWEDHLRGRVAASRAQEVYLVIEDAADQDVLHLVEVYNDPSEMPRNASAPWFAEYMKKTAPLLAGPPTMATGVPVWTKGVPA